MAKPPASPPSSDIAGVNRDGRVNAPGEGGREDAARIERGNDEARARPPSDSGSEATGD